MFHHRRITPAAYLAQAGILALVAANAKRQASRKARQHYTATQPRGAGGACPGYGRA